MLIEIKNLGEMDINAMVLIGASSKRGDSSKIGYFGSGLKYALAVLIRHGIMPKIFIGLKEIDITVQKKDFRGQSFNQIFIEGQPTSLTAEMGIDWEPWFAIREIYCNALDEGEATLGLREEINPQEGITSIYIQNTGIFDELLNNWDKYFSVNRDHDLMLSNKGFKAFNGADEYIVYRRGVRAYYEHKRKCLYHYDCSDIKINESRTLYHAVDAMWHVAEQIARYADVAMIKNIYDNHRDHVEEHFYWSEASAYFTETWLEVLNGRNIVLSSVAGHYLHEIKEGNCIVLNGTLARALKKRWPTEVHILGQSDAHSEFVVVDPTLRQQSFIDSALVFLSEAGYNVQHPIEVCVFEDKNVLAQAKGEKILLSVDVLEQGKRQTALAILEEYVHHVYCVCDESRKMQTFLFEKWFACLEEKQKVFL